jgi:hypothetical protein
LPEQVRPGCAILEPNRARSRAWRRMLSKITGSAAHRPPADAGTRLHRNDPGTGR